MSKRFTATEKWDRPWFRDLPNEYKLLWIFICDKCDIAGIWYVDFKLASFSIGCQIDKTASAELFSKQVTVLNGGSKWLINDFVTFQYGELTPNNNLHRSVIKMLENSGAAQPLTSPTSGAKVKVKVKVKVIKGVVGGEFVPPTVDEVRSYCQERRNSVDPAKFIDHYQANGWIRGKTKIKDWKACVRTWERNTGGIVDNTPRQAPDPNCKMCRDWTGKATGVLMAQGTGKTTPCPCTEVKP